MCHRLVICDVPNALDCAGRDRAIGDEVGAHEADALGTSRVGKPNSIAKLPLTPGGLRCST